MRGKPPVSPPVLWPAAVRLPARVASGRLSKATEARKAAATLCSALRVAWEGLAAPVRVVLAPFARNLAPSAQEVPA